MGLTQITTGGVDDNINIDSNTLKVDGTNNRVGIGTTSPSAPLHVNAGSTNNALFVDSSDAEVSIGLAASDGAVRLLQSSGGLVIRTNGNANAFGTGDSERMRIDSSGRVGIGTSSPAANLHLKSSTSGDPELRIEGSGADNGIITFLGGGHANPAVGLRYISNGDSTGSLAFYANDSSSSTLSERMRIDSSGRLGIGTSSPGTILNIRSNTSDDGILLEKTDGTDIARLFVDGTSTNARLDMFSGGSANIQLRANGDSHFSGGNVGIGSSTINQTSSGRTVLGINGSNNALLNFNHGDTLAGFMYGANDEFRMEADGTRPLIFRSNGSERMRLDNSGLLGVGVSSPVAQVQINSDKNAETNKHQGGNYHLLLKNNGDDTGEAIGLAFSITTNATAVGAAILHERDGGGSRGSLQFLTNGGSDTIAERMRITNGGTVLIKGTSIVSRSQGVYLQVGEGDNSFGIQHNEGSDVVEVVTEVGTTTGRTVQAFKNPNGYVGAISISGQTTTFETTSDYRLKENIVDLADGIDRIKQLSPRRFNFIADANKTVDGFIAHEAQAVVPEAVRGTHNEVNDDGNPVYQGIDQSKLVPLLTAALQEAIAKIETLETKVAALEAG